MVERKKRKQQMSLLRWWEAESFSKSCRGEMMKEIQMQCKTWQQMVGRKKQQATDVSVEMVRGRGWYAAVMLPSANVQSCRKFFFSKSYRKFFKKLQKVFWKATESFLKSCRKFLKSCKGVFQRHATWKSAAPQIMFSLPRNAQYRDRRTKFW